MHGNTVGRHGRTTDARGARVRRHGRVRRTSGVRRAALTLILCVAALLFSPVNAYADTGLGEYLNNPAGATSVAYEYLTGDSWDDISHEGNSAPATALLSASTQGDYRSFAAFVDSLYRDPLNATVWYSRFEGLEFLNACTRAKADIQQCLRDHPLNGGSGSGGSGSGTMNVSMTLYGNKQFRDSSNVLYSSSNYTGAQLISSFNVVVNSYAREFVSTHTGEYIFAVLTSSSGNFGTKGWVLTFYAFDTEYWQLSVTDNDYGYGGQTKSIPYKFEFTTRDGQSHPKAVIRIGTDNFTGDKAPYELTYANTYNVAGSPSSNETFLNTDYNAYAFCDDLGVGSDYVPPVSEPVNPTPPDPDEPSNEAPTNVVVVPTVFDTSDIVAAIEILDADLIAAFNNQNAYLRELFQYLNDDLARYFYTLDNDLVNCIKWLKQEMQVMFDGLDSDMNDGFTDVVEELQGVRDDIDYYLYRIEIQLNNLYTRLGQILSRMGSGGGGNTSTRPDPSDDGDGFLDWLLDLFKTGLEDLLETLNLTGLLSKFNLLRQKFPFSIPWDIAAIIALFVHEPVTPVIDIPYPTIAINGVNYQTLRIDFTSWQLLGQACRDGTFILFAFGLMLRTKSLLDGEKVS